MARKYKLLKWETLVAKNYEGEDVEFNARRIQALRDIPRHGVKAGDIGGYVNSSSALSHKDDCWIGGTAKVLQSIISPFSNIIVKGNALIDEEAEILLLPRRTMSEGTIRIEDEVIIKGHARIITKSCYSWFSGNFQVRDEATLYNFFRGSGNAEIYGSSKVEGLRISDNAKIYGQASVGNACIISQNAQIFNNAEVASECKIGDNAIIKDNAKVGTSAAVFGSVIIGGDTFVPQQSSVNDLNTQEYGTKKIARIEEPSTSTSSHSVKIFNDIKASIDGYQKDIINLIKYPTMSDLTDEHTLEMFASLKEAELYDPEHDAPQFKEAVAILMRKFMAAESNARKISLSNMDDEAKAKIEKAGKMFKIAANEASSETDKKNAFVQGFKKLEGVMAVPDVAVDEFRIRIGLPELEEL